MTLGFVLNTMNQQLDPAPLGFRCLAPEDLPLMHRWLNAGEAARWYARRPYAYDEVAAEYSANIEHKTKTASYVILYGDAPIGYIQTYRVADYPEYNRYVQADAQVAGLDLFIGEAAYLHRGLGRHVARKFLRDFVFSDPAIHSAVLGPEPANRAAIRAYAKAGFHYWKTIHVRGEPEPEYLMRIERKDMVSER